MVPLAVLCGCAIGTFTARTQSSRMVRAIWVMDFSWARLDADDSADA
jgi:hypothetical protein